MKSIRNLTLVAGLALSLTVGTAAGPGGCGGNEKDNTATSSPTMSDEQGGVVAEPTQPATPTTPATPVVPPKPPKASEVLVKVTNAVTSSMVAGGSTLVGGNTARGASLEPLPGAPPRFWGPAPARYPMPLEPTCSESAYPLDAAGKLIPDLDPRYAPGLFYCVLKQPTAGPEGVLGPLAESRGFVCLAEKVIPDLAYDGKARSVTIPSADPECLPDLLVRDINELTKGAPFQATVTASSPPAYGRKEAWSRSLQISINLGGEAIDLMFLFKDGAGFVAGARQGIKNGEPGEVFTFYLDTMQGILRYEQKTQKYEMADRGSSSGNYNRHTRVLITGSVNADGVFSSLTGYQGAVGDLYKHAIGDSDLIYTIKGDPPSGLKTIAHKARLSGDVSLMLDPKNHDAVASCSGSGDCSGNPGLRVTKAEDLDFIMHPKGPRYTTAEAWFNNLAPLQFNEVTLADTQP